MAEEKKDEAAPPALKRGLVRLEKNEIRVICPCHKDTIASSKGNSDFEKDGHIFLSAGKAKTRWCKEEYFWPEVEAKAFWEV